MVARAGAMAAEAVQRVGAGTDEPGGVVSEPIRVLIVEDQGLVAEMLAATIGEQPDMEVVGVATTLAEAVDGARRYRPAIVLMDYFLPDGDGAEGTSRIKADLGEETEVVILTGRDSRDVVAKAIEAGCAGFLTKTDRFEEVVAGVRSAHAGETVFSPKVLTEVVEQLRAPARQLGFDLTVRELEVLRLLARGRSTESIRDELFLSMHTVRNHIRNLMGKLDAHSKLEAVAIAVRERIISLEDFE